MSDVVYREVQCKSALNRVRGMPFEWSLNPYSGCAHACRYCFARAYHAKKDRDVGAGFDREIDVKSNFVDVLRAELRRRPDGSVAIGTATDPFQPCEGRYRLTRGSLEALVEMPMPATIITKSTLIVRDIDVLSALSARCDGQLQVCFSVPTLDRAVSRTAEPGTPPPAQRIRALAMLRRAGIDAGVLCAPVLPGLTDSEASLDRVARAAADAGATFFGWRPLKLDPEIRDYYFDFLATEFPTLTGAYARLYANGAHTPRDYQGELDRRLATVRSRYRFAQRARAAPAPRAAPPRQLTLAF
ncbi:MAG TPA: radical SAM protein [Candidatus Limnocylindria bacterium]|nr:radical SAM protein [Candidatus Limnocylindria bacterium]